jgi:carbonic anhydrase/acetyltransferase-like protein (isoleucine patch superfamily)
MARCCGSTRAVSQADLMSLRRFQQYAPELGARVYVDPMSVVLGQVKLGDDVSIWPFVAARGDVNRIEIGARSNIQDNTVLHVTHDGTYTPGGAPLLIGSDVTIGHAAVLHACTIEDACLIGMGAVILDKAVVGKHAMIGAGSVLSPGKIVEAGSLWIGNPARFVRKLSDVEIQALYYSAKNYVQLKDQYLSGAAGLI